MGTVLLQCSGTSRQGPCGLCGMDTIAGSGRQLCLAETSELVCDPCGRKYAAELFALLRLGDSAERVGRIASHGIFPPMATLLELAKAAEDFSRSAGQHSRRVA